MAVPSRRVVVTGIGVLTSVGQDAASFWQGLEQGRNGVRPIRNFDASRLSTRFAGEIDGFDAKKYVAKENRKSLRLMARSNQLAVAAAQLALDHGKVDKTKLDSTRFGVEFGAGLVPSELSDLGLAAQVSVPTSPTHEQGAVSTSPTHEQSPVNTSPTRERGTTNGQSASVDLQAWGAQGLPVITPLWMLKYLPNMLGCHISILHDAQGPNNTITESDVASLLALGEATRILRRNQADFFLVGGADSKINPLSMVRQCLFGHLSQRNEAPDKASRPFDRQRDGLVIGEGAGVLVVEDLEHARRRGAAIYCEVAGFGAAFERGGSGQGLARAIRAALTQAEIGPQDLDHVNAHGMSSVHADIFEARGLAEALGPSLNSIPVWGVKSYQGNLGAGSGMAELAASILAQQHGVLPATLNFEEADPACPLNVNRSKRAIEKKHFLKVGFTEMGQCAAVVCRKWE
ncbi:MAG: beta-ketoacyl-[acyl-carrier-protein] synthase family protein [Gemmataceae bacterium]|nr:beta-ketoacyl-[acyl-carrier-protein] synthase family protein [Gemmataceae bacterium]MCI0740121.1 beta-ketoacyl-[acyl-carrier-protein] synthase family protein [Gemmataceae bacterium]